MHPYSALDDYHTSKPQLLNVPAQKLQGTCCTMHAAPEMQNCSSAIFTVPGEVQGWRSLDGSCPCRLMSMRPCQQVAPAL